MSNMKWNFSYRIRIEWLRYVRLKLSHIQFHHLLRRISFVGTNSTRSSQKNMVEMSWHVQMIKNLTTISTDPKPIRIHPDLHTCLIFGMAFRIFVKTFIGITIFNAFHHEFTKNKHFDYWS